MDFNSISKSLQDAIVNVTTGSTAEEQHSLEENNIVAVIDGVRSDRKYNDADHAHNSLSKLVGYQKAKKAELYVNGEKTKHYELNKKYNDFEPKKLSEDIIDEAKEPSAVKNGKLQGHMVNFKPKGNLSGDEVVKKVKDIAKSLQTNHPDKVHKGAYSHGFGDYSFSEKHRGPKSGYVVVKSKEHLDAVKQHIKSHGASIQEGINQMEEENKPIHPMGLHVKPVKVGGKTKYHVHAVGKNLGDGIKVGEHLSDTELDDASEMGAKIKHLKEDQMVDKTIELHDDFVVDLPTELGYRDYLNAAQSYSEDPSEAILIADSFFKKRDESLVIENFMRSDIDSKIKAHEKAGSKVNDTKYSTKNGKPYAEYTVTDSEGRKTRYIHHGSTRRVERE